MRAPLVAVDRVVLRELGTRGVLLLVDVHRVAARVIRDRVDVVLRVVERVARLRVDDLEETRGTEPVRERHAVHVEVAVAVDDRLLSLAFLGTVPALLLTIIGSTFLSACRLSSTTSADPFFHHPASSSPMPWRR